MIESLVLTFEARLHSALKWDERKNEVKLRKHGLDFADAHQIFDLPILAAVDNRTGKLDI